MISALELRQKQETLLNESIEKAKLNADEILVKINEHLLDIISRPINKNRTETTYYISSSNGLTEDLAENINVPTDKLSELGYHVNAHCERAPVENILPAGYKIFISWE